MNNLTMNFKNEQSNSQLFTLKCTNNSSSNWIFFLYQSFRDLPNAFPLAWLASPYKISPGSSITFQWTEDYSFVWSNTGILAAGSVYDAGGIKPCNPQLNNVTTFSLDDDAPQLSEAVPGGQPNTLTIQHAGNIPNNVFSTGIGMSGQAIFLKQALVNTTTICSPDLKIYLAAGDNIQIGQVLNPTITGSIPIEFPINVKKLHATLNQDQSWIIS